MLGVCKKMSERFEKKRRRKPTKAVVDYWIEHYLGGRLGLCTLCGNSGVIDTRGRAISPAGQHSGKLNFCICPNGQTMRLSGAELCEQPVPDTIIEEADCSTEVCVKMLQDRLWKSCQKGK